MKALILICILFAGCAGSPRTNASSTEALKIRPTTAQKAVYLWANEHPQMQGAFQIERLNAKEEGYDVLLKTRNEHYLLRVVLNGDVWEVVSSAPCDADFLIPTL